ncbi:MAG TPA: cytochrome c-type biogenesis protein CcmH [Solirubrobacteraceae bacterium]|nr:cytochrome c-type biogenesis protein CcmH [Solirubrobacteraceae bacterium]
MSAREPRAKRRARCDRAQCARWLARLLAATLCAAGVPVVATASPVVATAAPVVATVSPAVATAVPVAAAAEPTARASLPTIERQVMCVTCKIPLNVAESAQASRERVLIRRLIAAGESEAQIKQALVAEYGAAVLALPAAKGFDLAAYLVPAVVVLALVGLLALLLPGWRRRAREQRERNGPPQQLSANDAARLQADLDRFD